MPLWSPLCPFTGAWTNIHAGPVFWGHATTGALVPRELLQESCYVFPMLKPLVFAVLPFLSLYFGEGSPGLISPPPYQNATLDIVPLPASIHSTPLRGGQAFYLGKNVSITWSDSSDAQKEALRLELYLERGTGWDILAEQGAPRDGAVHLALDSGLLERRGPESYRLEKKGNQLLLSGASGHGLFNGVQTLKQMISAEFAKDNAWEYLQGSCFPWEELVIEDAPRFQWRGMHLDVGRYMYDVADIKSFLDAMAFYKFNVFHWHLTEDQGWRIEIKAFPKLTEVGAYRASSPVYGNRKQSDGTPYGGFYTQDEIREIVAYAADLHIDVMPEIELPGHSRAAIAAYPGLGNPEFSKGVTVSEKWGVHKDTLSPSDYTLNFYEQVFDEVFSLFPFEFVHIGADEAPKTQWENSESAQARMKELGIQDEHALQAWFVAHFERYLSDHGRRLVGWDEIQEGGLPAGATMMVWRGWNYGVEAARKGHDIIMAPTSHTYFDYYQAGPNGEPEAIGGMLTLEKVYSFEPISGELTPSEEAHVLGAQAQLWSEYFSTWEQVEYMAFPRMIALAEVVWSPRASRDWSGFQARLPVQYKHLSARGIGYRIPMDYLKSDAVFFAEQASLEMLVDQTEVQRIHQNHGLSLHFTSDGSEPNSKDRLLGSQATFDQTSTLHIAAFHRDTGAQVGPVHEIRLVKLDFELAGEERPTELAPGLLRTSLLGHRFAQLPDFDKAVRQAEQHPLDTDWTVGPREEVAGITLGDLVANERFAARFQGWLEVTDTGEFTFGLASDDGSRLSLGGHTIVDLDGEHGHLAGSASVTLVAGLYPFELTYFDAGGAESLDFTLEGPGEWHFLRAAMGE